MASRTDFSAASAVAKFLPIANGTVSAELAVTALPGGTTSITLSGTGVDPAQLTYTPSPTLAFGNVLANDTDADTLDTKAVLKTPELGALRIRYATNTEGGSSGSPVFTLEWGLAALHHYGDPVYAHPKWNQGVPIDLIRARIEQNPAAVALLGGAS